MEVFDSLSAREEGTGPEEAASFLTPEEQVICRHQQQVAWPAEGTREYHIGSW
jgi:hypothetical protein